MPEARRLDIAFFVDAFPDLSVTFVIDQVVGMLARGHRVRVFAQRPGRADREHPDVERWELRSITHYVGPARRPADRVRGALGALASQPRRTGELLSLVPPFSRDAFARSLRPFFAAAALGEPLRCDVVHCHFGPNGELAAGLQARGLVRAPIVTTFHGYDMRIAERSKGAIYRLLRERGDRFLAISGYNRERLQAWGFDPGRIVDHHVGIDVQQFPFREARAHVASDVRVLCVANLVPEKGHRHLLRAFERVCREWPDLALSLRLVGDGPLRASLEEFVGELGLTSRVSFAGGRPRDEVRRELAAADLFVLPSIAEATPVALMEAQACGLPVIATRVGAVHEVVDEPRSGWIVLPEDADALASALTAALQRRSEWSRMGHAGREHVLRAYHLPRLLDELEEIYRSVAD